MVKDFLTKYFSLNPEVKKVPLKWITTLLVWPFFTGSLLSCHHKDFVEVNSPDGTLQVNISVDSGLPTYSVTKDDVQILLPSTIHFKLSDHDSLGKGVRIKSVKRYTVDSLWEQPWGETRWVKENYQGVWIELNSPDSGIPRDIALEFRVFDDGLAFRTHFHPLKTPENVDSVLIIDEKSEFQFAEEGTSWWIPAFQYGRYEQLYRKTSIAEIDTAHTPLTIRLQSGYHVSLHEADLTDYASYTLTHVPGRDLSLETYLVPWADGIKVKRTAPFSTPWRTIQVSRNASDLVESTMILNLNEPNVLGDVSWVEPSTYIGIWWGIHTRLFTFQKGDRHGATTQRAKAYIDFASEYGIPEVLVEGWNEGWEQGWWLNYGPNMNFTTPTPDFDLFGVQAYAQERGVRLQGYHETSANPDNYLAQVDSAFALYRSIGVKNVKIGQVGQKLGGTEWHHGQYGVRYYRTVINKAAEYGLGVNFHEPIKPTGERRTYPNMLTSEGARGQEFNAWDREGGNPPEHNTILPFTRLLAGPLDFTPGIFDLHIPSMPNNRVQSTLAHQLALYVVYLSPLQMAADLPENYINHPAFKFIQDVPVTWDATHSIDGEIGEFTLIARRDRNSPDWYLGGITNGEPREIDLDFSFLESGITYRAEIYSDGNCAWNNSKIDADEVEPLKLADYLTDSMTYAIQKDTVTVNSFRRFRMGAGGGIAIRLSPVP